MVSIVIPAYNEGQTIERCLEAILKDARPDEFEIVVVCNGCKDDTVERARRYEDRGVLVVDTAIPGKSHALNLGDAHVSSFPRFYVDADIQIGAEAIRDVAQMLRDDERVLVAAPQAVVDYEGRNHWVRSFYRVWTQLPYVTEGVIGSGVYAFSAAGRARFGRFPEIIADDEFARLQVAPHERACSERTSFTVTPPRTLWGVVNINTRARAGNYELQAKYPHLVRNNNTDAMRSLRVIATTPRLWPHAPIYLGVMACAKVLAHRKLRRNQAKVWERDETSRVAAPKPAVVKPRLRVRESGVWLRDTLLSTWWRPRAEDRSSRPAGAEPAVSYAS